MDRSQLLQWIRGGLTALADDVYLLEQDVGERAITAKLACYLHNCLPILVGEAACRLPSDQRLHVDCEYNRFGGDTKWFPWEYPVVGRESKLEYYTPVPDIILHRRGAEGPNILVIEAKKQDRVDEFTSLIDRLKLIGYLGPKLKYAYGLYLSLGEDRRGVVVATAELVEYATVRDAKNGRGNAAWNKSRQLVQSRVERNGRVFLCRDPDALMEAQAEKLNDELIRSFSFTSVKDQIRPVPK